MKLLIRLELLNRVELRSAKNIKTMKLNYLTIIFILIINQSFAQVWEQTYVADTAFWGGQGLAYDVISTQDGGYLMAGELDLPTGAIRHYIQLIKTDNQGTEQWRKLLGTNYGDVRLDQVNEIHELSDGGFLVGGSTYYNQQGLYIIRTDAVGDTIWTKVHTTDFGQTITSFAPVTNQEFVSLGRTDSLLTLYRTDTFGNITLQKTLDDYFVPLDIDELSNGDYIITGMKAGTFHLARTNTQGDTLWTKSFYNASLTAGTSVKGLPNGGFVIGGYIEGFAGQSAALARYDDNGNEIWQTLLSAFPSATSQVSDITIDAAGNFLVTGSVSNDFWVMNYDGFVAAVSPLAQIIWSDTLNNAMNAGGASIISVDSNCYVVAGASMQGYYLKSNCGLTNTFSNSREEVKVKVYPNPATDFVHFEIQNDKNFSYNLKLFDTVGRIVRDININNEYRLERQNLPEGLYYYGIYVDEKLVRNGKFIFSDY